MATKTSLSNDNITSSSIYTSSGNEIVTLCIGQCGTFMGYKYYKTIMNEHKIDENGILNGDYNKNNNDKLLMSKINTYFSSNFKTNQYILRTCFIDLDTTSIDKIRCSPIAQLIDDENMISYQYAEPSVIWSTGHYIKGSEVIDDIMDKIRKEIEICDYFEGFNMMHSICGGTGGGLGTLIALKCIDNYPDRDIFSFTPYPTQNICGQHHSIFEIYNSVLSIHQLIENVYLNFKIDNECLINLCRKQCKLSNPTWNDINCMISLLLSAITSPFRFHSEPNIGGLRRMYSMFTCFPRLHFLTMGHAPFWSNTKHIYHKNINKVIKDSLNMERLSNVKSEDGKYLYMTVLYRSNDNQAINKMNDCVASTQNKWADDFVNWITNSFSSAQILDGNSQCYDQYTPLIATSIANTTAIKATYQRISSIFAKHFKRKAFLHCYKGDGMNEMEFQEAHKNIMDLVTEYQDKQDAIYWSEDDQDDEEEESEWEDVDI